MATPINTKTFRHEGVNPDGTFKNEPGAVNTKAHVGISAPGGGCDMKGCGCSPGHWIVIGNGRTKSGVVSGKTLSFASRKDLLEYMKENKIKVSKR